MLTFAAGFVLGGLRTFVVAPLAGPTLAVSIEAPVILAISWAVCRWAASRYAIPPNPAARVAFGALAFAILQIYEFSLGLLVFGRTLGEVFSGFRSTAGAIGLVAQLAFAMIPLLQLLP